MPKVTSIKIKASGTRSVGYQSAGIDVEVSVDITEGDKIGEVVTAYQGWARKAVDAHLDAQIPELTDRAVEYSRIKQELRL